VPFFDRLFRRKQHESARIIRMWPRALRTWRRYIDQPTGWKRPRFLRNAPQRSGRSRD